VYLSFIRNFEEQYESWKPASASVLWKVYCFCFTQSHLLSSLSRHVRDDNPLPGLLNAASISLEFKIPVVRTWLQKTLGVAQSLKDKCIDRNTLHSDTCQRQSSNEFSTRKQQQTKRGSLTSSSLISPNRLFFSFLYGLFFSTRFLRNGLAVKINRSIHVMFGEKYLRYAININYISAVKDLNAYDNVAFDIRQSWINECMIACKTRLIRYYN